MKNSRLAIFFLSILMIIHTVCGCSDGNESPSPAESSPTESGTQPSISVSVFQYKAEYNDALINAAKEFSKDNKGIKIIIETVGEDQDYGGALRAKFNSNEAPAIFNIGGPGDVLEWKSKLADISEMEAAKNVMEGYISGVSTEGKILGLPYFIEGYGFIYNKKIFEEAQIDIKSIDSFDMLETAIKKLDKKKKELKIDAVFALPAKETSVTGIHLSNIFIAPEFDNDVYKAYQAKTLEFKFADAFKRMLDLQNNYSVQPASDMDYLTQVEKLFAAGKVAMIQQGTWAYPSIEIVDKELAKTGIGFLPIPVAGSEEDSISAPVGVPMYWAFNNSKPEDVQKAAKDFINWLYISELGKKVITEELKFIPAFKGFSADTVKDPIGKAILDHASAGKTINWVFMGYPPGWGEALGADILLYLQKQLTWDQVIKNAKAAWAEARK